MRQKNLWGQAAQGANYILSAAGIPLPRFSFEVAIVVHAINEWILSPGE